MNWPSCIAFLCCAFSVTARTGLVQTRDGKTYEGHIRLETNRLIIANAERDLLATVEATNLLEFSFRSEPAPPAPDLSSSPSATLVLPPPWQDRDIGDFEIAGGASSGAGMFRVRSSGAKIGGERDAFHFVFKRVKGDSEIVARVIGVGDTDPAAQAGVMMRESLHPEARHVHLAVTPSRGGVFQARETEQGGTTLSLLRGVSVPHWIKLKRVHDEFTGFVSRNGTQWRRVEQTTLAMPEEVFVGLAVTSMNDYRLNQSVFDRVREAPFLDGAFVPRLELTGGSMVVGRFESVNETSVTFSGLPGRPQISTPAVGRILLQWLPDKLADKIKPGQPGVLLTDGTFLEGEFRSIERGRVQISSVLHGLCSFDVNQEVIAVVLRRLSPQPTEYGVKTVDGSCYAVTAVGLEENEIVVQEALLGRFKIPIHELSEVRRKFRRG